MKLFIRILAVFSFLCAINIAQAQERDSTINTDSMYYQLYNDTTDWYDFVDDSAFSDTLGLPTTSQRQACRDKDWGRSDKDINLCNENPYVLIFHDDFKKFDENMWFKKTEFGLEWDHWNSDGFNGVCLDPDNVNSTDPKDHKDFVMSGQQIYLRENVIAENGKMQILTKPYGRSLGWCKGGKFHWQWGPGPACPDYYQQYFNYSSGRAQTTWSFSRGDNWSGGGIIVEAKIKVPDIDGLWPAFWMMSQGANYDEFDIFEFMDNEWNVLKTTIHAGTFKAGDQCREENKLYSPNTNSKRRKYFDSFHTYTFFYTDYSMAMFIDSRLIFQKHHTGRRLGISHYDCEISKGEFFGKRVRYCNEPMRIVFNTHVYCSYYKTPPDQNSTINTKMEVEYVNVWQKNPCLNTKTLQYQNDLNLKKDLYNVISAKKVVIDMKSVPTTGYHIDSGNFLKIIANDTVVINGLTVNPDQGRFEVEITDQNLCSDAFDFKKLNVDRRNAALNSSNNTSISNNQELKKMDYSIYSSNGEIVVFGLSENEISQIRVFDVLGRNLKFEVQKSAVNSLKLKLVNAQSGNIYILSIANKDGDSKTTRFYYNQN